MKQYVLSCCDSRTIILFCFMPLTLLLVVIDSFTTAIHCDLGVEGISKVLHHVFSHNKFWHSNKIRLGKLCVGK
jgi:hypothetical protein